MRSVTVRRVGPYSRGRLISRSGVRLATPVTCGLLMLALASCGTGAATAGLSGAQAAQLHAALDAVASNAKRDPSRAQRALVIFTSDVQRLLRAGALTQAQARFLLAAARQATARLALDVAAARRAPTPSPPVTSPPAPSAKPLEHAKPAKPHPPKVEAPKPAPSHPLEPPPPHPPEPPKAAPAPKANADADPTPSHEATWPS